MSIDERIQIGNILYIIDEEGFELYERVDQIKDGFLITNNGSWYLDTLGSAWCIKDVVRSTQQPVELPVVCKHPENCDYPDCGTRVTGGVKCDGQYPLEQKSIRNVTLILPYNRLLSLGACMSSGIMRLRRN